MATRRRLFDMLLRPAEIVSEATRRNAADDAVLLQTASRAQQRAREAVGLLEPLVGRVEHQRAAVDALAERARTLLARDHELGVVLGRTREAISRMSILALNAGLEGARIEGPAGRAVVSFAEQARELVARSEQLLEDAGALRDVVSGEIAKLEGLVGDAHRTSQKLGEDARGALDAAHRADQAQSELADRLQTTTGVDPELAKAIEAAQHHARELAASLSIVSGRGALAASAIRPILEPVMRLFEPVEGEPPQEPEA